MRIYLILIAILVTTIFTACSRRQIVVNIQNVGSEPLRSVVIHVTGNSYPIGDITPSETKTVRVVPKGESHIEIEHRIGKRLNAGGYYEPGYNGTVTIKVKQDQIVSVKDDVKAHPY